MQDITAIIKTILRPRCFRRTVESLLSCYPTIRVLVADDSPKPYAIEIAADLRAKGFNIEAVAIPYDTGLGAGRNYLLNLVRTPLFLLVNDDCEFYEHSDILKLRDAIQLGGFDIAAGSYIDCKSGLVEIPISHSFSFNIQSDELAITTIPQQAPWTAVDFPVDFFLAKTEVTRKLGGWNSNLKASASLDFFLSAKQLGVNVAEVRDVKIRHVPRRLGAYRALWSRGESDRLSTLLRRNLSLKAKQELRTSKRHIVVMGSYRSGTSCVSGVLCQLGVDFGECRRPRHQNPFGYFEHAVSQGRLVRAFDEARSRRLVDDDDIRNILINWRNSLSDTTSPVVGLKHPLLCMLGSELHSLLGDSTIYISVNRPLSEIITSIDRCNWSWIHRCNTAAVIQNLLDTRDRFLRGKQHMSVNFHDLLDNTSQTIDKLTEFVGVDAERSWRSLACKFVRNSLPKRHRHDSIVSHG